MSDRRVNERIFKLLEEKAGGDLKIKEFLREAIIEESDHPGQWAYKKWYSNKIKEFSKNWEENED